jgi:hypothetical protein
MEHRASMKSFVSLQFLNPKTSSMTPWTGGQPIARPLPTQIQKKADIYAIRGIQTHNPSIQEGRQFMP